MKSPALIVGLMVATLAGCSPKPPVLVPRSPHGGALLDFPDGVATIEVLREDGPDPAKARLVVFFLDKDFKPLSPAPTAVTFRPKSPKKAPAVELKPTGDADPARASGLASPPLDASVPIAGEVAATIAGKPLALTINVR